MTTDFHPLAKQILDIIKSHSMWYEYFEHEEVHTSEDAAKVRPEYSLAQGAKAIIIYSKKNDKQIKFVMLVVPGDKKFDSKKVKKLLKVKDIRFATEEEVSEITKGVKFGGIPPFGNLFGLTVIADNTVFLNEKIIFNAGDRRISIAIKSADYKTLVEPQIADILLEQ